MREILFRGKSLDTGEWVEGYFVKYQPNSSKDEWIFGIVPEYASALYLIKVDVETVGQFTGLTDKNGVKIFEGDILKGQLDGEYPEDLTIVKVLWRHTGWSIKQEGFDCEPLEKSDGYLFEVAGNIHDNPEMLEEIK